MTDAELAEIEARCAAATEGPWEYDYTEVHQAYAVDQSCRTIVGRETINRGYESFDNLVLRSQDAAFIASARTDVPKLTAALRQAHEALKKIILKGGHSHWTGEYYDDVFGEGSARKAWDADEVEFMEREYGPDWRDLDKAP